MSGETVIVRREADQATAARFQAAFKQAGGRLRVQPIAAEVSTAKPAEAASEPPSAPTPPAKAGLTLRPKAGELLDASERNTPPPVVVDTSHLSVAPVGPMPGSARVDAAIVPDVSHLSLAAAGATLSEPTDVQPAIDVDRIEFDVAPAGADLGQRAKPPAPPPPDVSNFSLV
jgi:hypothetical protein